MSEDDKRRWAGPGAQAGGGRDLTARVRAGKHKKPSSRAWLERHLNDPYVRRARAEGYRARAAYKLLELDDRFGLIKPGARVIDLGAAPGGWMQAAQRRGAGALVGVDLLAIEPLEGAYALQGDVADPAVAAAALAALGGPPDLVLSDMAANTTGHHRTDQIKTGALAEIAAAFALAHLKPGGAFVAKAFQGGLDGALLARLKQDFASVRHAKPKASRAESVEIYVVAQGRK
ncbi:MAG: RlmE family RNA methyltransferase [Hyphomonadaceae bacterium]